MDNIWSCLLNIFLTKEVQKFVDWLKSFTMLLSILKSCLLAIVHSFLQSQPGVSQVCACLWFEQFYLQEEETLGEWEKHNSTMFFLLSFL